MCRHSVAVKLSFENVPAHICDKQRATVTEAYWSVFTAVPARAAGAAALYTASHAVRRATGAAAALAKQVAKTARIGGSSNEELDDGSKELTSTARVGFSSEKFQVKPQQPVEINDKLVGGMMAKLMVVTEGQTRTEKWEVGRLKSHKKINVALPQGGVTVAAFLYVWQALDSGGKASGSILQDLSLDLAGCGPKGE